MYFKDVFLLLKMYLRPRKYRSLAMEEPLMGKNANHGNYDESSIENEEISGDWFASLEIFSGREIKIPTG